MNPANLANPKGLYDHVPICLYRFDRTGKIVWANVYFARTLGYASVDDLLASGVQLPPYETADDGGSRRFVLARRDGLPVPLVERAGAVRDEAGSIVCYDAAADAAPSEEKSSFKKVRTAATRLSATCPFPAPALADSRRGDSPDLGPVFGQDPHPMWVHDLTDLRFLEVNGAAIAKYGYSREEFLQMTLLDIRPAGEVPRLMEDVARKADHFNTSGPWIHRAKDGHTFEVEITAHDVSVDGRQVRCVMARDVTAELCAERALEAREAYYRTMIENTLDVITIIDRDGTILFESPSLFRVMGIRPEDAIGASVFDSVHPHDLAAAKKLLAVAVETGLPSAIFEVRMRTADGDWKVLEASARNLLDKAGVGGVVINSRDITERKRAERKLRISEERLRLAQQAGGIGTWEHNFKTGGLHCSHENLKLYGAPDFEGVIDIEEWMARIHPADRDRVIQVFSRAVVERTDYSDEFRVVWPDKSVHWLAARSNVITDEHGDAVRLLGVNIDISERKQIEEQLKAARDEALAASRMKSQFLATVSHEIRTPMNAIMGMAGLLLDTDMTAEQRADMEVIRSSGMHLLDLINDLLDMAMAESGKLVFERSAFDLYELLGSAQDLVEATAKGKGLSLRFDFPADLRRRVLGDAARVRQIILNFLSNAVKFTDIGSVTLRAAASPGDRAAQDFLRVSVLDTGGGIPSTLEPRLFGRFEQGNSTSTRKHDGTGLGLAISKSLCEAMGGTIGSQNHASGGAEFWVDLPLPAAPEQPVVRTPKSSPQEFVDAGHRVLVVEDNCVNQKVLVRLLQKRGIRADVASNGIEAIQMWNDFPYDLILMDCSMPEMDGYEATEQIRALEGGNRHLPIVAVTAHVGEEEMQRCFSSGMDAYLEKPLQPEKLDETLRRFLPVTAKTRMGQPLAAAPIPLSYDPVCPSPAGPA